MMHGLGEGVKEFKKGMKETTDTEKGTPSVGECNKCNEKNEESDRSLTNNDRTKK